MIGIMCISLFLVYICVYVQNVVSTFSDDVSSVSSVCPVRFRLNVVRSFPVLPSIEHIELGDVACSTTWLRNMFNIIKSVKHNVKCVLEDCEITSFVNGTIHSSCISEHTEIRRSFITEGIYFDATIILIGIENAIDAVREAWLSQTITSLSICLDSSTMEHISSSGRTLSSLTLSKSLNNLSSSYKICTWTREVELFVLHLLSSLTQLETLSLHFSDCPFLWEALRGLHIKSLSLSGSKDCWRLEEEALTISLHSLKHLETLSLKLGSFGNLKSGFRSCISHTTGYGIMHAICGLHIKSLGLSLSGSLTGEDEMVLSHSLWSLEKLETLSLHLSVWRFRWDALRGLHIKSLSLSYSEDCCWLEKEALTISLHSLKHLETLSLELSSCSLRLYGIMHAMPGLHIKSLSLSLIGSLTADDVMVLSHSLSSLRQLETLNMDVNICKNSFCLWDALRGLHIKSLSLSGRLDSLKREHVLLLSHTLSSLNQLETLIMDVHINMSENNFCLWKALRGLHIKSLSVTLGILTRQDESELSRSLSSLKQLGVLNLKFINQMLDLCNWYTSKVLKINPGLHLKNLNLNCLFFDSTAEHVLSLADSLSSLTRLETLTMECGDSPGLLKILRSLNIKSLSVNGVCVRLNS